MNISLGKFDDNMIDELTTVEPELTSRESPGSILSTARKELKWSIEDVAANLNLRVTVIEALEADDYTNLPGPTFVRGYQRSYARLLGIDEDKVVETDNLMSMPSATIAPTVKPTVGPQVFSEHTSKSSRGWLIWVGMIIIIVVAWSMSGIKLWGPDGILASMVAGEDAASQNKSEISVSLDQATRSGTTE